MGVNPVQGAHNFANPTSATLYASLSADVRQLLHKIQFLAPERHTLSLTRIYVPYSFSRVTQVKAFIDLGVARCKPDRLHICSGSQEEYDQLLRDLEVAGSSSARARLHHRHL